jgi:hypothetical protein
MTRIFAILALATLLLGCSKQLTVQGTVAGSDGTSPKYCMLMHKAEDSLLETTHFVPPNFRRTFTISQLGSGHRLIIDCAGYAQKEIPISSASDRNLGKVLLVPADGT